MYGHGGHLSHVASIMSSNFQFRIPESFHTKFASEWQSSFYFPIKKPKFPNLTLL